MRDGVVISIDNVSKAYLLRAAGRRDITLESAFRNILPGKRADQTKQFQALSNVSGELRSGEILGILGHNGAGKSTLLKIISGITLPSSGEVAIRGSLMSLLELGVGFHRELTGRENIFLNGAILGLRRAEVAQKLEEIIHFSEIGEFIDEPIKRYSSGMYVRLAFAVSACLDPDILIADEVLAVGDASFQAKCLDKLRNRLNSGKSAIVVSHDSNAIRSICNRAWVMERGSITFDGNPADAVRHYLKAQWQPEARIDLRQWKRRRGTRAARIDCVSFRNEAGVEQTEFRMDEKITLITGVTLAEQLNVPDITLCISTATGQPVFSTKLSDCGQLQNRSVGTYEFTVAVEPLLMPGDYVLSIIIGSGEDTYDRVEDINAFRIVSANDSGAALDQRLGNVFVKCHWSETTQACS